MEIKVKTLPEESLMNEGTHLFEGLNIVHKVIFYDNIDDYTEKLIDLTNGKEGKIIGIPRFFSGPKKPTGSKGEFLFLEYTDYEGNDKYLVVKFATIFITSKGQTIDQIHI